MNNLNYLAVKVLNANISYEPFEHIVIENFLSKDHIDTILNDKQIHFNSCENTKKLIDILEEKHYQIQGFPGCSTDIEDYMSRCKNKNWPTERNGTPVETFGITFRLKKYINPMIKEIVDYMGSEDFQKALSEKFNIKKETYAISAIQKNLSHYEISPHPDTRRKAMTYLLNINKDNKAEKLDIHTHLLKFKKSYDKVYRIWEEKNQFDRCWVPWEWCDTERMIRKNNTIVIFPTTNRSLHAVKLNYNHCDFQRTQIYGNLMYKDIKKVPQRNYKEVELDCANLPTNLK